MNCIVFEVCEEYTDTNATIPLTKSYVHDKIII